MASIHVHVGRRKTQDDSLSEAWRKLEDANDKVKLVKRQLEQAEEQARSARERYNSFAVQQGRAQA